MPTESTRSLLAELVTFTLVKSNSPTAKNKTNLVCTTRSSTHVRVLGFRANCGVEAPMCNMQSLRLRWTTSTRERFKIPETRTRAALVSGEHCNHTESRQQPPSPVAVTDDKLETGRLSLLPPVEVLAGSGVFDKYNVVVTQVSKNV